MERPRIRVLPDALVDQIAAGEVVESPASVVKELVENALDAGADHITIEVEGGGLALVRVADNGHGMDASDATLALQRHATSKIADASDLAAIRTLGFRGEALPSIASVSRLTLETRPAGAQVGTLVEAQGGVVSARPCATAAGTRVTVRDLFHNVPARLKFQKGERSRVAAIRDLVARTALAWPACHVTLVVEGRSTLDLPPCPRLSDRAVQVFGREACEGLHEFPPDEAAVGGRAPGEPAGAGGGGAGGPAGVRVSGVLGAPALARPDPGRVVLLVGGRPIQDAGLRRAVLTAYSGLVPEGRFPLVVVRLDLDPADVDVNVHPRKTEVRFRDARAIQAAVFEAVRDALAGTPWIRTEGPAAGSGPGSAAAWRGAAAWSSSEDRTGVREPPAAPAQALPTLFGGAGAGRFSRLKFVGQVAGTILVCEGDGTLVLVDQHAAHERVRFERLWEGVRSRRVPAEALLIPEVVPVSPLEASRLDEAMETLAVLGFDLEPYSGGVVAVRAVPAVLRGRAAAPVVQECLAAAGADASSDGVARLRKVVATVACHSAVRAGDPMGEAEVHALLQEMDRVDLAAYCPHGRQAVVTYPLDTVLRWFGR